MSTWQTCHLTERQQRSDTSSVLLLFVMPGADMRLLLLELTIPGAPGGRGRQLQLEASAWR
jgi:hypothetical protein